MATVKFLDSALQSWRPREKQYELWEGRGFGLRISPRGTKSFIFVYRFHGKQRKMSLGRYPMVSLAEARQAHLEAERKLREEGIDPGLETKDAAVADHQEQEQDAATFAELAERFIEEQSKIKKKTWKEDERKLIHILPEFGGREAASIKPVEISDFCTGIEQAARAKGGTGIIGANFLNLISRVFKYAIQRGRIEVNPCRDLAISVKSGVRTRYLTGQEVGIFWNQLSRTTMAPQTQLVFKLLLCTGQRKSDICQVSKKDIDLERRWMRFPQEKTKNGVEHKIYLGDLALEAVKAAWALSGESPYLFPGSGTGGHRTPRSLNRALNAIQEGFDFETVLNPHDLRRTITTLLHQTRKVELLTISRMLNHKDRTALGDLGIMEHYLHNSFLSEIEEAMKIWNELLEKFILMGAKN